MGAQGLAQSKTAALALMTCDLASLVSSPFCQMYLVRNFFEVVVVRLAENPNITTEVREFILARNQVIRSRTSG